MAERERTGGQSLQRRERARVLGGWDGGRPRGKTQSGRGQSRAVLGAVPRYGWLGGVFRC